MEDKYSLRKAWVEEEAVWRKKLEIVCDGGKIVEIACEKHRWRRDAGRDGGLHKKSNIDKRLVIENGICSPLLTVFESVRSTAP